MIGKIISEENLKEYIRENIAKIISKFKINTIDDFNSNLIDPISLLFSGTVLSETPEKLIKDEILRQEEKSVQNIIGYFNQNLFKYTDNREWRAMEPATGGWDIVNDEAKIYIEMKNKYNTMNYASSKQTYGKMLAKTLADPDAECWLVEIIGKKSTEEPWKCAGFDVNGRIKRMTIDKFMTHVSGYEKSFYDVCEALIKLVPAIFEEMKEENKVVADDGTLVLESLKELAKEYDNDLYKALFYLAFGSYDGFLK